MRHDIVLAGVGGQGILTIARVLSAAAMAKGLHVKQAEVHGLSQRGGAVYSHIRISDAEIHSDLIPEGAADMILAVEPMEALRYVEMLRPGGCIVASTNAVTNIGNYPAIEEVLAHIGRFPNHVSVDMEKLGRAAGSPLAANIVALGAASPFLGFSQAELEQATSTVFASKGQRIMDANVRALRFGRTAAKAYIEAVQRGVDPKTVRNWVESLSTEHLADEDSLDFSSLPDAAPTALSGAEEHAFENLLLEAYEEGRRQLYEHEVYSLIELVGAISPPRYTFVPKGSAMPKEALEQYPGDRVVVKLVSPEVVHKSEAAAVSFVPRSLEAVNAEIDRMVARHAGSVPVTGTLVVEFVEHTKGLGGELFVGIRSTREFGPVIAAGLGGLDTEYLAAKMLPGVAVAKAVAMDVEPEEFLEMFKSTAAYDVLAGEVRGHERVVSDGELLRCFRAFVSIARRFCTDRGEEGPDIGELEVNPFAFRNDRLVPLDGRGNLRPAAKKVPARPSAKVAKLFEPKSIAMVGVSSQPESFGRIVLGNVLRGGFDPGRVKVVKPNEKQIDGVACVPSLSDLPEPADLLVVTAPASAAPDIVTEANASGKVASAILVSGGAGETEGSEEIGERLREAVQRGRRAADGGTVFLGPNCMGVRSAPGRYDTFFIPEDKLPKRQGYPVRPLAIVSQSGAFIVSRLSGLSHLNPAFAVSIGNQCDVTVSDVLWALGERGDLDVVGVYLEGFADLDGLETLRAVESWTSRGRTVVFYKAGRTAKGRAAAAGHTAAVAGDYDICTSAMARAGALVVDDFQEFSQMLETATFLSGKPAGGTGLFAVTNAGMEAVGMADAVSAGSVGFAPVDPSLDSSLRACLEPTGLLRLVSVSNPLDLTPMAGEDVYDMVVREALASDGVAGLVVCCVPLAPGLKTLAGDLGREGAFPDRFRSWASASPKPLVFVVDGGSEYDPLCDEVRKVGVPVFRSADDAVRRLARWMESKRSGSPVPVAPTAPLVEV